MARVDQSKAITVTTESGTVYRFGPADDTGWRDLDRNGIGYRARIEGLGYSTWLGNVTEQPDIPLKEGETMVVRLSTDSEFSVCSTPIRSIRQD